jgi:hypothetical protein
MYRLIHTGNARLYSSLHKLHLHSSSLRIQRNVDRPEDPVSVIEQHAHTYLRYFVPFQQLSRPTLFKLLHQAGIVTIEPNTEEKPYYLYERNKPERHMTLVLEGEVEVVYSKTPSPTHESQSEAKTTTERQAVNSNTNINTNNQGEKERREVLKAPLCLGLEVLLQEEPFVPQFTARPISKVKIVRIDKHLYNSALKATQLELELSQERSHVGRPSSQTLFHSSNLILDSYLISSCIFFSI